MNAPLVSIEVILGAEAFGTTAAQGVAMEGLAVTETVLANGCEIECL